MGLPSGPAAADPPPTPIMSSIQKPNEGLPPQTLAPPWDVLPENAALAILHFLTQGHAKTARRVCRFWRDTLDSQATRCAAPTWPEGPQGFAAACDGAEGGCSCPGVESGGPQRPVHVAVAGAEAVDLSGLPPDEIGGRLGPLLGDLAQLTRCVCVGGGGRQPLVID